MEFELCLCLFLFILKLDSGLAVAPTPFRCHDCQGIDLTDCMNGGKSSMKICAKGVQSCYMTYRRVGATDQVARGCRDAGRMAKIGLERICSKSSLFGLTTIVCSCPTDLCNGNSTSELQGIPDRFFVEWRK